MKLIIDIPEKTVNEIKDNAMFAGTIPSEILWDVTSAIVNGTPLPKGHGRLIDADALKKKMQGTDRYFQIKYDIDEAPTVVVLSENVIGLIRAEIQTKYDDIWQYNDYDEGQSEALEWVLEVIDKYSGVRE